MGSVIAVLFANAVLSLTILDLKPRSDDDFARLQQEALSEVASTLHILAGAGLFDPAHVDRIAERVRVVSANTEKFDCGFHHLDYSGRRSFQVRCSSRALP